MARAVLRAAKKPAPKKVKAPAPKKAQARAKPSGPAQAKPASSKPGAARPKAASKPGGPATRAAKSKEAKRVKPANDAPGEPDLSVSGQIYRAGKLTEGVLHIDTTSGRIVRIAKSSTLARHLDFGNNAILPGAIDVHVHFREPGHTHKEDLTTGSVAAAFGGVTSFVDMPNTLPATISLRSVKEKLVLMAQRSVVDYGAWAGGSWYTGELPQMLEYAVGVKTYLGATTGDLLLEDADRFPQILAACAAAGRPAAVHAESNRILNQLRRQEGTLQDHDTFRPALAEVEAIYDAMKAMAGMKKPAQVHVAHASTPDAVQAAHSAKFSIGVTPHHLLLDTESPFTHAYGKVNPPLRAPAVRKALFEAFAAGRIPILESDHAPHTSVEKEDNFHAAPSGMPGVETLLPVLLPLAKSGKLDLGILVDAVTKNPASLLGTADRGVLDAGMKADFAVYDLKKVSKVDGAKLHSRCGWSPFEGHNAIFPTHTYLAGKPVVEAGELVASPGSGRSILPLP